MRIFCGVMLFWMVIQTGYGQTLVTKKRTYANFQGNLLGGTKVLFIGLLKGSIDYPGNAINGNPKDFSTLSIDAELAGLASITQFLEFTSNGNHNDVRTIPAGQPVSIKLSLPKSILSLLSQVNIGYFRNLKTVSADWPLGGLLGSGHDAGYDADKYSLYSGSDLLSLANGAGEVELTFSPEDDYNGIFVELSGSGLSLALTNNLFHAYIVENGTVSCADRDKAIDVLSGIRGGGVNLLNATGSVTNPWAIIDGTGQTTLNLGVQLLSEVFHTTIFNTASKPNQIAKVVIENPGGGLLDLGVLKGLEIQPYLGNTPVGEPLNESSILSLRLLPGAGEKNELTVPVAGSFDRIEVKLGGVAAALGTLILHGVSRTFGAFLYPIEELGNKLTACEKVDLKESILNYQPADYDYRFYTASSGGAAISGIVTESGKYYIEAVDKISGCVSARVEVDAVVLPLPGKPHLTIRDVIN